MAYNAHSERTFQALQKQREESVKRLRIALERSGLREYVAPPAQSPMASGIEHLMSKQPPQRLYDIETVIANATQLREALADFDASVPPPATSEQD